MTSYFCLLAREHPRYLQLPNATATTAAPTPPKPFLIRHRSRLSLGVPSRRTVTRVQRSYPEGNRTPQRFNPII
jgi:hypothetical protein